MAKSVPVLIGGVEHLVPPLSFKKLKRVWILVQAVQQVSDPMDAVNNACQIVALGLIDVKGMTTEELDKALAAKTLEVEDDLLSHEIPQFRDSVRLIMVESGLLKDGPSTGEATGEESLTGISTPSLQNSSQPDALAETGTE